MFRKYLIATLLLSSTTLFGVKPMEGAHIHEAFMTNEAPITLLTAVQSEPPAPLKEIRPEQKDSKTIWVPGYWEWSHKMSEFVWCSGNWRLPPPDHIWIEGHWHQSPTGWVRTKGFWSTKKEPKLSYISQPPPDQLVDNQPQKPGDDSFWMTGYWKYERKKYVWYTGKWENADKNWIYVPARYIWREQGYVFCPAYWDWPIEYRGTAYACVIVPPGENEITYTSDLIVSSETIIQQMLVCCPNYSYFYHYYYLFHPNWWAGCAWCPPWWGWDWWSFPWADQWGLWWWWGNPGFPAPFWLDGNLVIFFWNAPNELMMAMQQAMPPLVIGPNGLIPPLTLINDNNDSPIFPEDPVTIQEEGISETEQGSTRRPGGRATPEDITQNPHELPLKPTAPESARPGKQPTLPRAKPPTVQAPPKPTLPPRTATPPTHTTPPQTQGHTHHYTSPPIYQYNPPQPRPEYRAPIRRPHRPYTPPQTYQPRRPKKPPQTHQPRRPYKPRAPYKPPTQSYRPQAQSYKPRAQAYRPRTTTPRKSPSSSASTRSQTYK